jgi:hypothetical protein
VRTFMMGGRFPTSWLVLCGISVRGRASDGHALYAAVVCGGYTTGPHAKMNRATGSPAVLRFRGAGGATKLLSAHFPRQGHWSSDVDDMFPRSVRDRVLASPPAPWPTTAHLLDIARRS